MTPVTHETLCFTPPDLVFDETLHRYTLHGQPQLGVTGVLREVGLIDLAWCGDEAARARGTQVHKAIEVYHGQSPNGSLETATVLPYLNAYRSFLADSAFGVATVEERVCDPRLRCAGTLDIRGRFLDGGVSSDRIDLLDVKTGTTPPWVGYQTAGYVRLLPVTVQARVRRWCLTLFETGRYRLDALTQRTDEVVFLAALTIAQAKRGWL